MNPVLAIVARHVELSEAARAAIVREMNEAMQPAAVGFAPAVQVSMRAAVDEEDSVLSTEQAAQLVGVSRPFLAKLIDTGVIELHQRVGKQRRVLRSAVMRWQANERARQLKALKRLGEDLDSEIFGKPARA